MFWQVVNLRHSEVHDRMMLTGRHMVRDVYCKSCDCKLGWIYEFAVENSQRYWFSIALGYNLVVVNFFI